MDKNGYRAPIITAAIITAIATLILAIATVIAPRFNQPAPVVVKIQPPAQSDPLPKEPPLSSQQPDEPVEEEQSTVSNPSSQPAPPPSSEKPVQRIETKPITDRPIQRPETNPNYVLKDGEATFVSSIATSLSATFQNVESVEFVTLVIAPKGRDALRQAVMGAGDRPVEFETDSGTYRAQVLSIDWNRKKATVRITQ